MPCKKEWLTPINCDLGEQILVHLDKSDNLSSIVGGPVSLVQAPADCENIQTKWWMQNKPTNPIVIVSDSGCFCCLTECSHCTD